MFHEIFPIPKPIIGMIHLPPLLGYPEFTTMDAVMERALGDLHALERGDVDGVAVENEYDHPHQLTVGPAIIAAFTRVVSEVVEQATIPVGLQVLLNDWRGSLAIAKATGARFVRLDFFVDRVRIKAGIIEPDPAEIIAYRRRIKAEDVALFTDVQVKYSELLEEGKSLTTSSRQAVANGADAIIVTGRTTGDMPVLDDLREAREAVGDFPVLVGSGTTSHNVRDLFRHADGSIVGTALKSGADVNDRVVEDKVRQLMDVVREIRAQQPEASGDR